MQFADFFAVKLFEDDERVKEKFKIEKEFGGVDAVAECRYRYIDEVLAKCCSAHERVYGQSKFDKILLNRFLAFPIFLLIISAAFYLTFFSVGAFLSDGLGFLLDRCIATPTIKFLTNTFGQSSWIVSLFQDAIFGGVGYLSCLKLHCCFSFYHCLKTAAICQEWLSCLKIFWAKLGFPEKAFIPCLWALVAQQQRCLLREIWKIKILKLKLGCLRHT